MERMSWIAWLALSLLRHAKMTWAPLEAKAFAVSKPIPQLAPVTIAHFPLKSSGPSTSSVVLEDPSSLYLFVSAGALASDISTA